MGVVKICKIRKCKNLHLARGLCIKHYSRFKRHGNPETCLKAKKTILHLKTIKKIKDSYKKKVEIILLTKGKYSIIDKKDFIFLEQYNWIYVKHGYALAKINGKSVYMHRIIMNCPNDMQVDHINGDGLDNRKINLRICSTAQNTRNTRLCKNNKTGFKGVAYDNTCTATVTYRAQINCNKKIYHLGNFLCLIEAAKAYDAKAIELFGEFARTNKLMGRYD